MDKNEFRKELQDIFLDKSKWNKEFKIDGKTIIYNSINNQFLELKDNKKIFIANIFAREVYFLEELKGCN